MKKKILATILFVLSSGSVIYASDDAPDSLYKRTDAAGAEAKPVLDMSDRLTLRTFVRMPIMPIGIEPEIGENETSSQTASREKALTQYLPNLTLNLGAGFNWKWFGASYAQKIVNFGDTGKEGKTESTDIRMYMYKRKCMGDLIYFNYKGFHLAFPADHGVSAGSSYAKRSNMKYVLYEANLYYIFSEEFSMQAAFEQTERQQSWDWSFMGMLSCMQY